jgi:hypothetical protein
MLQVSLNYRIGIKQQTNLMSSARPLFADYSLVERTGDIPLELNLIRIIMKYKLLIVTIFE